MKRLAIQDYFVLFVPEFALGRSLGKLFGKANTFSNLVRVGAAIKERNRIAALFIIAKVLGGLLW